MDVTAVGNAEDAIKRALTIKFDLFLLDPMGTKFDGIELCRQLRVLYPLIPIVMFSDRWGSSVEARCRAAGADEFIRKSDFDTLVTALRRFGILEAGKGYID